jgi:hypothetical protein
LRDEVPEIAARALSLLANRDFEDAAAFDAWWKVHSSEKRTKWVVGGFGDALEVPEWPFSQENVPSLIELLEDERIWIRVNAQRFLHEISGEHLALRQVLDTGKTKMGSLSQPPPLRDVVPTGTIHHFDGAPAFDITAMLPPEIARDILRPYAESSWSRAAALWRQWWEDQRQK